MNRYASLLSPSPAIPLVCAALVACTSTEQGAWREEVELGDGRIVVVERTVAWQETQAWGQAKRYIVREMTVSLPSDVQATLTPWRGRQELAVLLDFDADRQEYLLVALPGTCVRYREAGRPSAPYLAYALRNGEWTIVPLDTTLIGRRANLIVNPRVAQEPALVTVSEKAERQKNTSPPEGSIVATGGLPGC
jgi:hypothetical protein